MTIRELLSTKLKEKVASAEQAKVLEKTSGPQMQIFGKTVGEGFKRALGLGLGLGGAGLAIGAGAAAASSGCENLLRDPIKKKVGIKRMYRENDWLGNENPSSVKKLFNTLYTFSPRIAMDPLTSGAFMKRQLEYSDVGIQPTDIQTIANIEKAVQDRGQNEIIRSAFSGGSIGSMSGLQSSSLSELGMNSDAGPLRDLGNLAY